MILQFAWQSLIIHHSACSWGHGIFSRISCRTISSRVLHSTHCPSQSRNDHELCSREGSKITTKLLTLGSFFDLGILCAAAPLLRVYNVHALQL